MLAPVILLLAVSAASIEEKSWQLAKPTEWWQTTTLYQIWPRTFKDSDGDGIGDLNGITSKLDHFVDLGIETIWLSPFYPSPGVDAGYDVADFKNVNPEYGTLDDFKNLVARAHERGLKVIVDFVPNHVSEEHEWFVRAKAGEKPYVDYFIWNEGKIVNGTRQPPNNWANVVNTGSAWDWLEERQSYYYHQFFKQQIDLNLRNPEVIELTKQVLTFWLDLDVDGFRVDALPYLYEDEQLRDEPTSLAQRLDSTSAYPTDLPYTKDLPENFDLVSAWRQHIDSYNANANDGRIRIIFTEAYANVSTVMHYYKAGSHVPFNFFFIRDEQGVVPLWEKCNEIAQGIDFWMSHMPIGDTPNWVMGNHDNSRIATKHGAKRVDAMNVLLYTLPGVAVTYNGEEIGMEDMFISWENTHDPQACYADPKLLNSTSRDPERTPLQWDNTTSAGFSTNPNPFLPVNENYRWLNVAAQKEADVSHYKVVRALNKLRRTKALKEGSLNLWTIEDDVIVYTRETDGEAPVVVMMNWNQENEATFSLENIENIPEKMEVLVADINSGISAGDVISKSSVTLPPTAAVVCRGILDSEE